MLQELDDEFGVGDIVSENIRKASRGGYTSRNLAGLRVEHAADDLASGGSTILTLRDDDILKDDYEDVLVNVNIVEAEKTKKSLQNIKEARAGYQAYDQEEVDDVTGEIRRKGLLSQYDEEIDGLKKDSFVLETGGEFNEENFKQKELQKIRHKLKLQSVQSLVTPELRQASDYYTTEEMATFKKPKKKKKVRKKVLKADDLLKMSDPDTLLPTGFGEKVKKRAARIVDDDEVGHNLSFV